MPSWPLLCSGSINTNSLCYRYVQFLLRRGCHFLLYRLSLWNYMSQYWYCVSNSSKLSCWVYLLEWSWNSLCRRYVLSFWNTRDVTLCWRHLSRYYSVDFLQIVYCWQLLSPPVFYTWMCYTSHMPDRLFLLSWNRPTYRLSMPTRNLRSNNRTEYLTIVH